MQEKFVRFGQYGLASVLHSPNEKTSICVITCHGLFSSKDSEKYVDIAEGLCREDIAVLRFDFRGCGESWGLFEETSLTRRMEDLSSALDFMEKKGYLNTGVMGSSLGGTASILTAAKDERVKALVTWAAPCSLDELFREGIIERLENLRLDAKKYDVVTALRDTCCPILIVHGSLDELVPTSDANALYKNANEPKDIKMINGADHRFIASIHRRKAIELTVDWFRKHLK